jgi:hypothetical protein
MRPALSPIHADAVDVQDLGIPATRIGVKPKLSAAIGLPFAHRIARPNGGTRGGRHNTIGSGASS